MVIMNVHTGMAYPIVKEIMKQFSDKVYFVFRNSHLNDTHPHAQHAAEAAAAQDKFWQMHDYLFEHQDALDDIHLLNYVQKMDLDIGKFKKEMSGHVYAPLRLDKYKCIHYIEEIHVAPTIDHLADLK